MLARMLARPTRLTGVAALTLVGLMALTTPAQASAPAAEPGRSTRMTPRLQWNANDGYCGEVSFISAGMALGQYASQWTVRSLSSPGAPQWDPRSSLLLGTPSERRAARAMRLETVQFASPSERSVREYLGWVKSRFDLGDSVIIGVLDNKRRLGEPLPGDSEYDHIVPVFDIGSGRITISDNGLYGVGAQRRYLFTYPLREFPRSRAEANAPSGPVYSLRNRPRNYATAVTGIADPDHVTVPVRLTSDLSGEGFEDQAILRRPPAPLPMVLTAHVSIPEPGRAYRVYLYDDFARVPIRDFNAHSARSVISWTILAGTSRQWSVAIPGWSDQTYVVRAVPIDAP